MVKSELIKRSPLRLLEKSIHGGVGKGNIAAIASRKGVGKTACLVHIATDKLFQGKHVIHVSFSSKVDYIIGWYEDIFKEIAKKRDLESAVDVHDEIVKNRVIMNFNQEAVEIDQVVKSLEAMVVSGNFKAECVIVDGYDFEKGSVEDLDALKAFAADKGMEIWFSVSLKADDPIFDESGFPVELKSYKEALSVIFTLKMKDGYVKLNLVKDHDSEKVEDTHLKLDSKTLLIAE